MSHQFEFWFNNKNTCDILGKYTVGKWDLLFI
jgi:hypothetical protein